MNFEPIGRIESCFEERFGIPRQPGLVPAAKAVLALPETEEMRQALRGLEGFSHVWLLFVFHDALSEGWRPLVRPPRLGGERKMGVFATRSPHRPNPIGMSVVALERIEGTRLHLAGVDLLDGTPVLDIKPYVPYADSVPGARSGWTDTSGSDARVARLEVVFSERAAAELERLGRPELRELVRQVLERDPRPAHQAGEDGAEYAFKLAGFDVHWRAEAGRIEVLRLERLG